MTSDAATDLISQARRARVAVVGGGIAGLVAALHCAKVGIRVTMLEASDRLGGIVSSEELDGTMTDIAADGFRIAPGALQDLVDELGLRDRIVTARDAETWVAGPHGVAPLPDASVLGIPANPFDARVRRIVGTAGSWRAYVDRLRPPLTIGVEHNLGTLVQKRMGARVLERMVAPLTYGIHGVPPEQVDVDRAARGLNSALTRTGSLSGAVAQQLPDADAATRPSRGTIDGGMSVFVDALAARLADLDVEIRTEAEVTAVSPTADGWTVTTAGDGDTLDVDAVIVATPERPARGLIAAHLTGLDGPVFSPDDVDVVTLVLDAPALDSRPRGHAVYAVPGEASALAVVHATATWPHAPGAPHIVRVTLPASEQTDAEAIAASTAAAAELLGTGLGAVRASSRARWPRALPSSALSPERDEVRRAARTDARLGVVGAWIDGTGLARVATDAKMEAERIRSGLLWHADSEGAST
ncbi:protoporphyrinogen/coproporphyrinogen oxidase [Microbacterium oleivorans]|uniref:protoporphyrinogen/coproporphyrinogen oxidase n=1 Tax=Microbacterium oleivorans TaxID=273677 RepID=UPI0007678BAE|nr:FAD-dependent oxidoreductase [Microbacterium oleivorans]AZS44994.1 Protoporphyrinogen oxidase [Microbacterium oleivorans]